MLGIKPPLFDLLYDPPEEPPGPPLSIVVDCSKNFLRPSDSFPPRSVLRDEDDDVPGTARFQSSTLLSSAFGTILLCVL